MKKNDKSISQKIGVAQCWLASRNSITQWKMTSEFPVTHAIIFCLFVVSVAPAARDSDSPCSQFLAC